MIFLTGDTHADFTYRFSTESFPEQEEMTKDDYVIVCGDFGGVWDYKGENKTEKYWLDWFESRSYTLLFIDGNHENFERLYSYPVKDWHGGKVHEIRPHVLHLMRGQVFEIEDKKFFTFGGASSHDVSGGILEPDDPEFDTKKRFLEESWRPYRINHRTWWKEELPNEEEMEEGRRNLQAHGWKVDYIVTHCCSSSTQAVMSGGTFDTDIENKYFEEIKEKTEYKKWFFGHYHKNINIFDKEIPIYEQIIRIV